MCGTPDLSPNGSSGTIPSASLNTTYEVHPRVACPIQIPPSPRFNAFPPFVGPSDEREKARNHLFGCCREADALTGRRIGRSRARDEGRSGRIGAAASVDHCMVRDGGSQGQEWATGWNRLYRYRPSEVARDGISMHYCLRW